MSLKNVYTNTELIGLDQGPCSSSAYTRQRKFSTPKSSVGAKNRTSRQLFYYYARIENESFEVGTTIVRVRITGAIRHFYRKTITTTIKRMSLNNNLQFSRVRKDTVLLRSNSTYDRRVANVRVYTHEATQISPHSWRRAGDVA